MLSLSDGELGLRRDLLLERLSDLLEDLPRPVLRGGLRERERSDEDPRLRAGIASKQSKRCKRQRLLKHKTSTHTN